MINIWIHSLKRTNGHSHICGIQLHNIVRKEVHYRREVHSLIAELQCERLLQKVIWLNPFRSNTIVNVRKRRGYPKYYIYASKSEMITSEEFVKTS